MERLIIILVAAVFNLIVLTLIAHLLG